MKVAFYNGEQAATSLRIGARLVLLKKLMFLEFFLYTVTKIHTKYIVFLQRKKWYLLETLWCIVYGLYHQLFDQIYAKLTQEIYYNICRTIKKMFDGICDGLNVIETNLIRIQL